jgi:lauroyl/myristoyl acyltransferase
MIYWLLRSATWLIRWIPSTPRQVMGGLLCQIVYWGWPEKRRNTIENMAHILGRPTSDRQVRQVARRSWHNYGRYVADFLNFPNITSQQVVACFEDKTTLEGGWREVTKTALARGKGVLMVTAHFGNWDSAGALFASHFPCSAIAETFKDPRLNHLIQSQRAAKGLQIIPLEGSGARKALRALHQGEIVAIVVDRPLTAKDGVPITFFGQTTYVPGGPAALALKVGAAIVPGFAWYANAPRGTFYSKVWEPIIAEPESGKTQDEQVRALTQRIYNALEEMIRTHPDQWFMFRAFWPQAATSEAPRASSPLEAPSR